MRWIAAHVGGSNKYCPGYMSSREMFSTEYIGFSYNQLVFQRLTNQQVMSVATELACTLLHKPKAR